MIIAILQGKEKNEMDYLKMVKSIYDTSVIEHHTVVIYGNKKQAIDGLRGSDMQDFKYNFCNSINDLKRKKINILNFSTEDDSSIKTAIEDYFNNKIDVVLFGIEKNTTENSVEHHYKDNLREKLLSTENSNTEIIVTNNIRLLDLSKTTLEQEFLVDKIKQFKNILCEDFGIQYPRIAIIDTTSKTLEISKKMIEDHICCVCESNLSTFLNEQKHQHFDAIITLQQGSKKTILQSICNQWIEYTLVDNKLILNSRQNNSNQDNSAEDNQYNFRQTLFLAADNYKRRENEKLLHSNKMTF